MRPHLVDAGSPLYAPETQAFAIRPDQAGMSYHINATWRAWMLHINKCPICPAAALSGACETGAVARGEFVRAVALRPDLADSWPEIE